MIRCDLLALIFCTVLNFSTAAADIPRPLSIADDFKGYDRQAIIEAADEWRQVIGEDPFRGCVVQFSFKVMPDRAADATVRTSLTDRCVVTIYNRPADTVPSTSASPFAVLSMSASALRAVMRHEFGHVMGLGHSSHGVMSGDYAQAQSIDVQSATIARLNWERWKNDAVRSR